MPRRFQFSLRALLERGDRGRPRSVTCRRGSLQCMNHLLSGYTCMFYDQANFDVRCEWGLSGARFVGGADCVMIVVDVMSFSTCVDIATSFGAAVFPYRWKDQSANAYADRVGAELAGPRGAPRRLSLSPASMLGVGSAGKIVLPSPNGSELTVAAKASGQVVIAGCFRNCRAVAHYASSLGKPIAVIACGEQWPDGTLRPGIEDYAAAGAIIAELPGTRSPEAIAAIGVWNIAKRDLERFLVASASGRELMERGFEHDVQLAAQVNVSLSAPVLREDAYVDARRG